MVVLDVIVIISRKDITIIFGLKKAVISWRYMDIVTQKRRQGENDPAIFDCQFLPLTNT
jgi:hypothetical protein